MSQDPVERILDRLEGSKRTGEGRWMALCPAHHDRNRSLSVGRGEDGRALVHCHAGCAFKDVVEAAGLEVAEMFVGGQPEIVAEYDYCNKDGEVLYQVVRYRPKDFRQRRPDGKGGWIYNMQGVTRVPYRLPELVVADAAQPVFIVEGEKDVENLRTRGLIATCNVGGAGKWRDEYSTYLKDRKVIIIPDNDLPGQRHAQQVAKSLRSVAAEVRILSLPKEEK